MRKWMLVFTACILMTACSAEEENKEGAKNDSTNSQEYNEAVNTEGEEKPLSVAELDDRIDEGMNIDTYSAEVQSWAEKGQLEMEETVTVEDENTSFPPQIMFAKISIKKPYFLFVPSSI
ncbi:hypothetical protein M3598_15075 [Cytobacillus oceanisediminis]|uniref:hypothetical protein n=1 Tax=Cytobacillus oceanisediminis TaxID=665099 RepID=UPI00203B19FF|nr:hypothetical protein [Cytobacillus oceanisediminis]MCM3244073.1 hypothetical protein [Cytobacillus oceanisediminis]